MERLPSEQADSEFGGNMVEAAIESAVNAIMIIDEAGLIRKANPSCERMFGYTQAELLGRNVNMLMPEPDRSAHDRYMHNYMETGAKKIIGIGREVRGRRRDGSSFPMHLSVGEFRAGGRRYFIGTIRDISKEVAQEEALRQVQRMEALGQLTGGIAHDFNNLLTIITGNLELLDLEIEDAYQRDLLKRASDAAHMGARLTGRLLTFARRRPLDAVAVNLNDLLLGIMDLLRRTLGETIGISSSLAPDLWVIRSDVSEIENAVVNLAINARDAMPSGGKLMIETRNVVIDDNALTGDIGLAPGRYVRLSVSDTGEGIAPDILPRVFEPFFTTKGAGRGTGLGLSVIYGFARQSGGQATIYSEPGHGTTVNLYLPDAGEARGRSVAGGRAEPERALAGELIMVVEDQAPSGRSR